MNGGVKIKGQNASTGWMIYFVFTITVIGGVMAPSISIPLFLLARIFPRIQPFADRVLQSGVALLLKVQPWLKADGQIHFPEPTQGMAPGCLLISNHRSHLDAFVLLSQVKGVRILAKRTLFFVPFLGVMMFLSRHIPTRRGRLDSFWKAMDEVRKRLQQGETVHVFPEMTRCPPGFQGTQVFSPAPFLCAMQQRSWIVPIAFKGTDDVWPKGHVKLRPGQKVQVKCLDPIDPAQFATAQALKETVQQRINEALV